MNELQMIQLLNVIIAFLIGAAIGMAIMMCNYGFFHRAVAVFRQKKRAARGMATSNKTKPKPFFAATTEEVMRYKSKDTCVSHKFSLLDHEPVEVSGLPKPFFHFDYVATTEEIKAYKPRTWSDVEDQLDNFDWANYFQSLKLNGLGTDVEDTDQEPHAANPHKLYDVIYMCDTQGEVMATDLSYGDAQATVRCFAEDMHEEQVADLVIREMSDGS